MCVVIVHPCVCVCVHVCVCVCVCVYSHGCVYGVTCPLAWIGTAAAGKSQTLSVQYCSAPVRSLGPHPLVPSISTGYKKCCN